MQSLLLQLLACICRRANLQPFGKVVDPVCGSELHTFHRTSMRMLDSRTIALSECTTVRHCCGAPAFTSSASTLHHASQAGAAWLMHV